MTCLPRLTFRKVSVLLWVEAGLGYKEIASLLDIHESTVRLHVTEIAAALPKKPDMPPRDKVLLFCERLLVANADIVADVRANHAA